MMPLAARVMFASLLACLPTPAAATAAESPPRLIVMEPEIDGDTSDASRQAEWQARLALVTERVTSELTERDLYEVLDPAAAEAEFAKHRLRADVHACEVCAQSVARAAGADRVLSLWVFRMSNLVLSLHAIIRDGPSGTVRYARALDFRGDNDRVLAEGGRLSGPRPRRAAAGAALSARPGRAARQGRSCPSRPGGSERGARRA
jgi:hypothetical protein